MRTSNISKDIKEKLTSHWVDNHVGLIIQKLKGYEYNFKSNFRSDVCTPDVLLDQLRYRLDLEFIDGKRSILYRICEQDIPPSRPMVLYVSSHHPLCLSDGWYEMKAGGDVLVEKRLLKLKLGSKILTCGAQLSKEAKPGHPLDDGSQLVVSANSTRRVKWYTKLGYFNRTIPAVPLSCTDITGGMIYKTELTILRRYPDIWLLDDAANKDRRRAVTKRQRDRWFHQKDLKNDKRRESVIDDVQ